MAFLKKINEIFQTQFTELIDKIEDEVYLFLEELLIKKGISLDAVIDYKNPDFRDDLHEMVGVIISGLQSIGIKEGINELLNEKYSFFKTDTSLKTYKDWLYKEFKNNIDFILSQEILKFFTSPELNIINRMINFDLIDESFKDKLLEIKESYPNFINYLSLIKNIETALNELILNNEVMGEIYKFQKVPDNIEGVNSEEIQGISDLNELFLIYRLGEYFNLDRKINLSPAVPYLISEQEKWSKPFYNVSLRFPLPLYSGLYLTETNEIEIDKTIIKKSLEQLVRNIISRVDTPIFSAPEAVYYIVESMGLLKLKLNAKILQKMITKNDEVTSLNYLKEQALDRLGLITLLFNRIGLKLELKDEERAKITDVLKSRYKEGIYLLDNKSKDASVFALWGAFEIISQNNLFNKEFMDLGRFLSKLINELNKVISKINNHKFDLEDLAALYWGCDILNSINKHYDAFLYSELESYLFSKTSYLESETQTQSLPLSEQDNSKIKGDEIAEEFMEDLTSEDIFEPIEDEEIPLAEKDLAKELTNGISKEYKGLEESDLKEDNIPFSPDSSEESAVNVVDDFDFDLEDINEEDILIQKKTTFNETMTVATEDQTPDTGTNKGLQKPESVSVKKAKPLPTAPKNIVDYLISPAALADEYFNKLAINFDVFNQVSLERLGTLENIYKFILIEKILRIKHKFSNEEIVSALRPYFKGHGFGEKDVNVPDVMNTFFGLYIYDEYKMMSKIDIYKIHDYLLEQIKYFTPFKMHENKYLFLSLKLLEKYGIELMEYRTIPEQILGFNIQLYDEFNILIETFNRIIPIIILKDDASLLIRDLQEEYMEKLRTGLDPNSSLNGIVSDTARALITIGLLGEFGRYKDIAERMVSFLTEKVRYFDKALETSPFSWNMDETAFAIELNMLYWTLLALMTYKPFENIGLNPHFCPNCRTYFKTIPKFCNICGYRIKH